MGREAKCVGHVGKDSGVGRLLLETNEIVFRGPFRLSVPLKKIRSAEASDGTLRIKFGAREARFNLGKPAGLWAKAIREPKGLLDKLGIKDGQRVRIVGLRDPAFARELKKRRAEVLVDSADELDHLFFEAPSVTDLHRLAELRRHLKPDGALWVLRRKGPDGVSESATRDAGRKAGLVDVKVVAFSAALTAEKFVIPKSQR